MTVDASEASYGYYLEDGTYNYTYTCNNYCGEHSWTITSDGATIGSGSGYDNLTDYSFTVGGVYGCTDPDALNYNPDATDEDGSCSYAGSTCDSAIALELPASLSGSTCGSGDDYSSSVCYNYYISGDDYVYTFTTTEEGTLNASISGPDSYNYLGLHITSDCIDSATECAAYAAGSNGGSVVATLPAGTYFATVSTWATPQCASFDLSIEISYEVAGCMLEGAPNYNADAELDDGSCQQFGGADYSYWNSFYPNYYLSCDDADGNGTMDYMSFDADGDGLGDDVGNGNCQNETGSGDYTCISCDGGDYLDCSDVCSGTDDSCEDECGIQNGDNSTCSDCAGTPNGTAVVDSCGNCGGDCVETGAECVSDNSTADTYGDYCTEEGTSDYDNNPGWCGNYDGTTEEFGEFNSADQCCACGGGTTSAGFSVCGDDEDNAVVADCAGVCGGSLSDAGCGCGEAGPSGCDNTCGSTLENDCCDVCDGDGSSCAGGGDTNNDGSVSVNDIVMVVSHVLESSSLDACGIAASDMTGDGTINVLDVIQIVEAILGGGLARTDVSVPSSVELIQDGNRLSYKTDVNGLVGFEFTLYHDGNCEFNLTKDAFIADLNTSGNTTKMVIVNESGSELFTSTSDFEILEVLVGSANGAINASIAIVPEVFGLSSAYPNPFNPSTSVELAIPTDGFASVKVYNLMGQVIATLHEGHLSANTYSFTWDGTDVASGMYFLQAESAGNMDIQKIMLMK
jgi:hypothetical protein